jgi:hypothetical protein
MCVCLHVLVHVCLCVWQTLGQEKERLEAQVHQHPADTQTHTQTHTLDGPNTSLRTSLEANRDGRGVGGGAQGEGYFSNHDKYGSDNGGGGLGDRGDGVGRGAGVGVGGGGNNSKLLDMQAAEVQRGYLKLRRLRQEFAETQRLLATQGFTDQPWNESVGLF